MSEQTTLERKINGLGLDQEAKEQSTPCLKFAPPLRYSKSKTNFKTVSKSELKTKGPVSNHRRTLTSKDTWTNITFEKSSDFYSPAAGITE